MKELRGESSSEEEEEAAVLGLWGGVLSGEVLGTEEEETVLWKANGWWKANVIGWLSFLNPFCILLHFHAFKTTTVKNVL